MRRSDFICTQSGERGATGRFIDADSVLTNNFGGAFAAVEHLVAAGHRRIGFLGDRPGLYTAAHCIGTQAAAATLNTFWFFDAAACGGKSASDYRQLTG